MIVVFDTNALISAALLEKSTPSKALFKAIDLSASIVFSEFTFAEFIEVLHRKKLDRYFKFFRREEFIAFIEKNSLKIPVLNNTIAVCRDPKDNMFLELAVAANASCIITGDPDLLVLHPFRNIPILQPNQFLEQF